jgi:hypothetical protein
LKEELFMPKAILVLSCMLMLAPGAAVAQNDQSKPAPQEQLPDVEKTLAIKKANEQNPRFVRTLTNVQIELTLTDQAGTQAPEKKTVSMIVSSGNWGKVRSVGNVRQQNDAPFMVDLNVDARPFVSVDGPIQLELTLVYSPPGGADKDTLKPRPTGINQSLTVVLQSGKPLIISQAADPVSDRKVIVEVKATVLK